jgi:DNA-binding transcriptional MerR regulator
VTRATTATRRESPALSWSYKMADLCRLTGMPRQAIHFYIREGLIPAGHKTGRNNARYGDVHVERIRIVRQLQNERFMPLKAIRAVLDGRDDAFTPEQRGFLVDVKRRLATTLARPRGKSDFDDLVRSWAFELLGEVRRAGFARELGFDARLLEIYERTVARLLRAHDRHARMTP